MSQNPSLNEESIEEVNVKNQNSETAKTETEAKPGRRGRKKKMDSSGEENAASPRRRRTAKTTENSQETGNVKDQVNAVLSPPLAPIASELARDGIQPSVKKRRGRPRKNPVEENVAESLPSEELTEEPARNTRSSRRSRKAKEFSDTESIGKTSGEILSFPVTSEPEETAQFVPLPSPSISMENTDVAPSSAENTTDIQLAAEANAIPNRQKLRTGKPRSAEVNLQTEPGNQDREADPIPENDLGNRVKSQPRADVWVDDAVVTNILPVEGSFGDIRSHYRVNSRTRRKRDRDAQPLSNASPYLAEPYQQNFFPSFTGMEGDDFARGRRSRNGRARVRRNTQNRSAQPEEFNFNTAMLNDSILGVALSQREENFLPEDDGPQPVLPDQPVAVLPVKATSEEDLEALDAAVNGNSIVTPKANREHSASRKGRSSETARNSEKARTADKAKNEKPAEVFPAIRRVLYVSSVPDEQVEVAIAEDGNLVEYFVEMAHQVKIRGNIYKGVINNLDSNLQAAFVNFGNGKNGFLQIDEVHPEYYLTPHDPVHGSKYPPIQKVLKVGQELLVQVVREPSGAKGAFLTTWITIAGRFLVLTPGQEQIGVSRKVEDAEERARLKELLSGIQPGENMGVIIRTASEGASKSSIQQDMQYLNMLWKDLRKRAAQEKSPCLIYQEADLVTRSVRDYLSEDIEEIWVDDEAVKKRVEDTAALIFPERVHEIVKLHMDQRQTLWDRFNLTKQIDSVTSREVLLPSRGRLVFDQTEALMAIDINSGKTQGKSNFEAMVFRTNMEAAETIARHLRLRDIGGQVVIDFIEMRDKSHCREVEHALRNAMRRDKARHDIGHMSSFGLLELVRQRTGTSAISISCEPCPHCHGTGLRRNMEWQSLQALRDLQAKLYKASVHPKNKKETSKFGEPATFVYENELELALYLLNRKRDRLAVLEEKFGVHIEIRPK